MPMKRKHALYSDGVPIVAGVERCNNVVAVTAKSSAFFAFEKDRCVLTMTERCPSTLSAHPCHDQDRVTVKTDDILASFD